VGKWAFFPQTRMNTGFVPPTSTFKSGLFTHISGLFTHFLSEQSSKICPIFRKTQKAHFATIKSGQKLYKFLKVYGRNLQKEEGMNPSF
jgi:hypothetical protein